MPSALLPILLFFFLASLPPISVESGGQQQSARLVETAAVRQYWATRCATSQTFTAANLPATTDLFANLPIVDLYLEYQDSIYFIDQYFTADLSLTDVIAMKLLDHQTEVLWSHVFYLVAPDKTNPGAARFDARTSTLHLRTGCVAYLPILAPFQE
jgi:hypothetical protein